MKKDRHARIIELIKDRDIETQEELATLLRDDGFDVTQATVSRDIRKMNLIKVAGKNGKLKYAAPKKEDLHLEKYINIFREAYISHDYAQNILVIKTVSGMASPVGAAFDALRIDGVLGCISGDDTVMVVLKTNEDALRVSEELYRTLNVN